MSAPLAFLSTYPPRRCGIATFASDLRFAVGYGRVAVVRRAGDSPHYGSEVTWYIERDERSGYGLTASRLREAGVRVVSIQHEYGIFGGPDGGWLLDFLDGLDVPVVATLHTILPRPTDSQREVLLRLMASSATTVVMSSAAARLLRAEYGVDGERIRVVPHGVPDLPLVDPDSRKEALGLAGRTVILSFGLIGPGKGYEHMIEAMARLRRSVPNALFVVLGATHPDLLRLEGERYREGLAAQVEALGLGDHVRFVDRYVDSHELGRFLQAADVYVTPYPNLDQIASGTLSYAVGAGKAVVSTPYAHARELLRDGRGVLVEPASGAALAAAIEPLLCNPELRRAFGRRAWIHGRTMTWRQVGASYRTLFAEVAAPTSSRVRLLAARAFAARGRGRLVHPVPEHPVTVHG